MKAFIYTGFLSSLAISNNNSPAFNIEEILNSKIKKSIFEFHKSLKTSIKITLPKEKSTSVIYNTLSSAAVGYPADVGHSLLKVVSPSINWSALGQTLFQRACFISELFGKGLSRKEKISYRKEKDSNRSFNEKVSKFIKETSTALKFLYFGGDCIENG